MSGFGDMYGRFSIPFYVRGAKILLALQKVRVDRPILNVVNLLHLEICAKVYRRVRRPVGDGSGGFARG